MSPGECRLESIGEQVTGTLRTAINGRHRREIVNGLLVYYEHYHGSHGAAIVVGCFTIHEYQ